MTTETRQKWSEQMYLSFKTTKMSHGSETHLVELACTFPAEIMLTGQNDHRLVEDLLTKRTDEVLLQPLDC